MAGGRQSRREPLPLTHRYLDERTNRPLIVVECRPTQLRSAPDHPCNSSLGAQPYFPGCAETPPHPGLCGGATRSCDSWRTQWGHVS